MSETVITTRRTVVATREELNQLLSSLPQCQAPYTATEFIDGRSVQLTSGSCQMRYRTSAVWQRPLMYFFGSADRAIAQSLQWDVYRTVRFDRQAR